MDEISEQSRFWIGVVSASLVKCGELGKRSCRWKMGNDRSIKIGKQLATAI
ncbi:hypothetical protein FHS16_005728 [Paenibacillus endophyticus]|uniref:Uncharacterized protein n=1 Tax=Paenibacillus endophyticus TaxID=1294268 RepID=A0A7W5GD63_9BACL|nr:hypothetical protein [Paenibacillus endophyticus]